MFATYGMALYTYSMQCSLAKLISFPEPTRHRSICALAYCPANMRRFDFEMDLRHVLDGHG